MALFGQAAQGLEPLRIAHPSKTGNNWILYLGVEGGYFRKYGLDVQLLHLPHPANLGAVLGGSVNLTSYTLEQALQASYRDYSNNNGSLVILGSTSSKAIADLVTTNDITKPEDLRGKLIAVSQIGDTSYNYTVRLLKSFGMTDRDVKWLPVGPEIRARAAALVNGRAAAALIPPPTSYVMIRRGFPSLANLGEIKDFSAPSSFVFTRQHQLSEFTLGALVRAQAEAVQRFYTDKDFAVRTYAKFDSQLASSRSTANVRDIEQMYDQFVKYRVFQRIPFIFKKDVATIADSQIGALRKDMLKFDFCNAADASIVDRLVFDGFFRSVFGEDIDSEESLSPLALRNCQGQASY